MPTDRRSLLFTLGLIVAVICVLVALDMWLGLPPLNYHWKRAAVFLVAGIIAAAVAFVFRPVRSTV